MFRNLGLYRRLISIHIRGQMQYRGPFLFELFSTGFLSAVGFLSLVLVFQRFNSLAGWTLGEIAFLFGMVEFSFGWMDMIFSGFDPDHFSGYIHLGAFDQMLLRPISLTLQVMGSEFVLRRIGRVVEGSVILAIAVQLAGIHWTLAKALYLPVVIASLICFFGGIFIVGSTIIFWTVQSIEAVNIFSYGGSEMISYPMSIYPEWMRRFFTYIIPAIFLNYYPALYFLDKPDPFHLPPYAPFLSPLAGVGLLGAAFLFWNVGVRHYQSTGT